MVVSNIFYFHPCLRKIPILTNIFQMGWNHQLDYLFFLHKVYSKKKITGEKKSVICMRLIFLHGGGGFFPAMAPDHIFQVISIAVHGLVFFACHRCISGRWSITTLRSHLDSLKNGQKQISGVANFYCTCLLLNTFRIILPFQPKLDVQIHKSHLPQTAHKKKAFKKTPRDFTLFFSS